MVPQEGVCLWLLVMAKRKKKSLQKRGKCFNTDFHDMMLVANRCFVPPVTFTNSSRCGSSCGQVFFRADMAMTARVGFGSEVLSQATGRKMEETTRPPT